MQDDNNKNDDLEFDDFDDISDLDDLDTLGEDDLGAFDDDMADLDTLDDLGETAHPDASIDDLLDEDNAFPPAKEKKSFVQKNFNLLVFGGVGVIGVALAYGFLMSGPSAPNANMAETAQQQDAALDNIEELQNGVPPMPAPMDTASVAPEDEGGVLTPMPSFDDAPAEPLPMDAPPLEESAPLDLAEAPVLAEPEPSLEPAPAFLSQDEPVLEPAPELAPPEMDNAVPAPAEITLPGEDLALEESPQIDMPPMADAALPVPAPAPAQNAQDTAIMNEALDQARNENQSIRQQLGQAIDEIGSLKEAQLSLEEQIETLKAENERLMKAAQSAPQAAPATPSPAPAAPEKTVAAPPPVKPAAPKAVASPAPATTPATASKVQWVLRSAQPGQAVISPQNGQDMMRIAVGDTVPGLGQIQSIAPNAQGLWVVQGSAGRVSQ